MRTKYPICNHREESAPKILGKTFILCWRCTGVMLSFLVMAVIKRVVDVSFGTVQIILGILMMIPIIIDGGLQYFLKYESTNVRRFITGIGFGIGFSLIASMLC